VVFKSAKEVNVMNGNPTCTFCHCPVVSDPMEHLVLCGTKNAPPKPVLPNGKNFLRIVATPVSIRAQKKLLEREYDNADDETQFNMNACENCCKFWADPHSIPYVCECGGGIVSAHTLIKKIRGRVFR